MARNEAAAALVQVSEARRRLADRARWPLHRHALFGLMEGLLIAGIAQPAPIFAGMIGIAMVILVYCVTDDRRRHGMFVSGWQGNATRPLMVMLAAFVVAMVLAALAVRSGDAASPLGYALGLVTFAVCTAASLRWETVYRRELACGA